MIKVSPARLAAFEILQKIERERAFSSALLPIYEEKLVPKDKSLCHALTLGVLRNRIYLDRIVQSFSRTKTDKFDSEILNALRLGLFQLRFLDRVPAHSAINESVNLVHLAKKRSASGLVNAILRRAARENDFKFEFADDIERVSIETSHPRWLVKRWTRAFGFEETEKLTRADNQTPPLAFRLTNQSDAQTVETLRKLDLEIAASTIARDGFRALNTNEMLFAFAESGKIYFQEESSQLVAEAVKFQSAENFLDVCAAPGSKFTQCGLRIAERRTENRNSRSEEQNPQSAIRNPQLFAGDLHEHRLRVLRVSAAKQGLSDLNLIAYDAENALPFAAETFDRVLLDAPCSGTGTIRHNPEIRYFLREADFQDLQAKQLKILTNASKTVRRGGRIIYSTCSLEREENEALIEIFLSANDDFETVAPDVPSRFLTSENFARTVPARDDCDGFFIAVLQKK